MLLRTQGARGDDEELDRAVEEYSGHALALTLLGSYLSDVYVADIRPHGGVSRPYNSEAQLAPQGPL
jgi:hypothetical protein